MFLWKNGPQIPLFFVRLIFFIAILWVSSIFRHGLFCFDQSPYLEFSWHSIKPLFEGFVWKLGNQKNTEKLAHDFPRTKLANWRVFSPFLDTVVLNDDLLVVNRCYKQGGASER